MESENEGRFYVVATPIGNLEDITLRAIRILREVDLVLAEDTRTTAKLFEAHDISTPLESYTQHTSDAKHRWIVDQLQQGKKIALVSEAGTPGISDPGVRIISQVAAEGIPIIPIPGASALTAALSIAGISVSRFLFLGFLPHKKGRQKLLKSLSAIEYPIVLYESPYRIGKTLQQLHEHLGDRHVVVLREATKMYEEIIRGTLAEVLKHPSITKPLGEFVVIVDKK
ncbi:MAG: 16S rRNA (cytidine(1402)-2'-O)-methyltransferase [Parcubacteria group bacterium]|nr:16S rRNA (cytidine(1402)-2'-O)-methyltransferase [Parcubacteria group bacterium]